MNLYDATVPIFTKFLAGVGGWLDKAAAHSAALKFDPETLLQARLAPDQYPLVRQLQAACDQAKFTVAKLTGKEAPSHPDTEVTLADIRARLETVKGAGHMLHAEAPRRFTELMLELRQRVQGT